MQVHACVRNSPCACDASVCVCVCVCVCLCVRVFQMCACATRPVALMCVCDGDAYGTHTVDTMCVRVRGVCAALTLWF